jgi:dienelactone hydrolase
MVAALAVALAVTFSGGCGTPPDGRERLRRLEPHFATRRPSGAGPFPAVMLVPGCGGFPSSDATDHFASMAERLRDDGNVVIHVDYVAARGMRRGCEGPPVGTVEIAQDVVAAAAWLRERGYVRSGAISAIGESLGGGGILAALSLASAGAPGPFGRAAVYFPVCVGIRPWRTPTPILMLLGALDEITPPATCRDLVSRLGHPESVTIRVYPEAHHAFNDPARAVERLPDGRTIGYRPQAAGAAWTEVERFLRR